MAFKGESDDTRSSLSYKLKRILRFKAREVLCTDPFVSSDPDLLPLDDVIAGPICSSSLHHTRLPEPDDGGTSHRHMGGRRERDADCETQGLDHRHRCTTKGKSIVPYLDRLLESVTLPCEVLVVYDSPDDTTAPWVREVRTS